MSIKNANQATEGVSPGASCLSAAWRGRHVCLCGSFSLSCAGARFQAERGLGFPRACGSVSALSLEPWLQQVHSGLVSAPAEPSCIMESGGQVCSPEGSGRSGALTCGGRGGMAASARASVLALRHVGRVRGRFRGHENGTEGFFKAPEISTGCQDVISFVT